MHERARAEDEISSRAGRVVDAKKQEAHQLLTHGPMTADNILGLQRAVGNAAVAQELEARTARRTAGATLESKPYIERHGEAHSVQRMPSDVQGAFGTWTMKQNPAGGHGSSPFLAYVYAQRRRTQIDNPWQSNFAVLEYIDNATGQSKHLDSFNVGARSLHSEEAIFWRLNQEKIDFRPVALFSDRKPCGESSGAGCMGQTIGPAISAKARGFDVPIYFATDYPPGSQTEIKNWWQ